MVRWGKANWDKEVNATMHCVAHDSISQSTPSLSSCRTLWRSPQHREEGVSLFAQLLPAFHFSLFKVHTQRPTSHALHLLVLAMLLRIWNKTSLSAILDFPYNFLKKRSSKLRFSTCQISNILLLESLSWSNIWLLAGPSFHSYSRMSCTWIWAV